MMNNIATENFTADATYQAQIAITESIDLLAEGIYEEMITSGVGMNQIITALAEEDLRELEALALDAALISQIEDEIPIDSALTIMGTPLKKLPSSQRGFWFAVDEMAGRLSYERAESAARRGLQY